MPFWLLHINLPIFNKVNEILDNSFAVFWLLKVEPPLNCLLFNVHHWGIIILVLIRLLVVILCERTCLNHPSETNTVESKDKASQIIYGYLRIFITENVESFSNQLILTLLDLLLLWWNYIEHLNSRECLFLIIP